MLFSKDYNDEITEEMIDTYKNFKKLASTDPEEAIELLEDEFDINSRRAKQIVNRLQKQEESPPDFFFSCLYFCAAGTACGLAHDNKRR